MKLSIKALALTAAIIWSAAILVVGIANMMYPNYAVLFLELLSSIYPGYQPFGGISSVIIGAGYGFVDAGIGGAVFAWIYNCFVK